MGKFLKKLNKVISINDGKIILEMSLFILNDV